MSKWGLLWLLDLEEMRENTGSPKIEVSSGDQDKTSIQYWGNVSTYFKIMVTSVSD